MSLQTVTMRRGVTGWHALAIITGFFVLVVGFDIWFAVLAYRSAPGQTADDPYEAGLHYQQTLAERRQEAALGWRAEVFSAADGSVEIELKDAGGGLVSGLAVSGVLTRPATEKGRLQVKFRPVAAGRYRLDRRPPSGAWDLDAVATGPNGARFELNRRLQWR